MEGSNPKSGPNWTSLPLAEKKSVDGEDIDENNKTVFDDMVNAYPHM